uniref:Putative COP-coated vesicle membrane protein erv25 n=1 Tax=Trypanosoma congolense (strain IL3000) TaxID=1068625 RepID=G0UWP0_TRYCI|nr:putative COP-coated vesicle membrane protein erv25 precursor [Trypanosoma congolense IL3000]
MYRWGGRPCMNICLLFLLAGVTSVPASAVSFLLQDTDPFCFVEEVEEDSKILSGEYTRQKSSSDSVVVKITVTSPDNVNVWESEIKLGTHSFTTSLASHSSGKYNICVAVSGSRSKGLKNDKAIPISLTIDQKRTTMPENRAAKLKRQKVNGMEVFSFRDFGGQQKDVLRPPEYFQRVEGALTKLSDQISSVRNGVDHIIERFTRMSVTAENTHKRIWAFGALLVMFMLVTTWLQFRLLKSTLRQKKLV